MRSGISKNGIAAATTFWRRRGTRCFAWGFDRWKSGDDITFDGVRIWFETANLLLALNFVVNTDEGTWSYDVKDGAFLCHRSFCGANNAFAVSPKRSDKTIKRTFRFIVVFVHYSELRRREYYVSLVLSYWRGMRVYISFLLIAFSTTSCVVRCLSLCWRTDESNQINRIQIDDVFFDSFDSSYVALQWEFWSNRWDIIDNRMRSTRSVFTMYVRVLGR